MKIKLQFTGVLSHLNGQYDIQDKTTFQILMKDILGNYYRYLFDEDGTAKACVVVYKNGEMIEDAQQVIPTDGDQFALMTAQSGG